MQISGNYQYSPESIKPRKAPSTHGEPSLMQDTVTTGGEQAPPRHLSRELLAQIQNKGLASAGKLTASQEAYLKKMSDLAAAEGGLTKTGALFGIGGVLFPDSSGRIKHLALQFGNMEFDRPLPEKTAKGLLGVYKTLFANMHPETRFTVVTADEKGEKTLRQAAAESGMVNPGRVNIVNAHSQKGFSIWIRDSMIPVANPDGTTTLLMQDRTYWPGPEDAKITPLFAQGNSNLTAVPHPSLRIDGGNMLSNEEFIFVGQDSVVHTTDRLKELFVLPRWKDEIIRFYENRTGKDVVLEGVPEKPGQVTLAEMWRTIAPEVFESEFERQVYVICQDDPSTPLKEEQPVFHIDMAVTPVGNRKFLVGDPGMAIRTFQALTEEEKAKANNEMAKEAGFSPGTDLIGKLIEVNGSDAHQANFDNVARELKEKGYEVERIPCMIGLRTTWSLPYLTYNNSIQENYTDESGKQVKKVYLPTYGCEPLEKIALDTYTRNGYEVVPLKMAAVSILEGAIRCSSYPVERTDIPGPS
ncbi:MAG: hypothetical protein RDV48_02330 [Candidatus Eremiobacteraeota bacterium]|nr:hypothetical protein [Candidatus Eremiobacteraeota bacterium]